MLELHHLRNYLRAALALAPLAACSKPHTGGCSPQTRCAPAAEVTPFASGSATSLGCPTAVADNRDCHSGSDGQQTCAVNTPLPTGWAYINNTMQLTADQTRINRSTPTATTCCYLEQPFCPGRPLVIDGRATVAARRASISSTDLTAALAEAWVRDALAEHASIASFARAALELMAVGAPLDLVNDAAAAMRDEVRHTELCCELAARYGAEVELGALPAAPARRPDLAQLAHDTFVEGCVGETIAALVASRALADCRDPQVSRVLRRIADDEARHAALAWRTLAWAIAAGGAPVVRAVREVRPLAHDDASIDPRLAVHGRLDPAALLRTITDAWSSIIEPMLRELAV